VVHVANLANENVYVAQREPSSVAAVELGGIRTLLLMPMLKEKELIGAFSVYRQEVRPFTDKQIELVQNFAAQAVIAIENARLLSELRESLEQQTATADVLKVISSSLGELEPVFTALLENGTRLCGASYGSMWLAEGDAFRCVAIHGVLSSEYTKRWGTGALIRPGPDVPIARAAKTKRPFQISDIRASQVYRDGNPLAVSAVDDAGMQAIIAVPMLKENDFFGAIAIYSKEARSFTDKQIELLENFASQAVIAIENARLLNELRQRTDDLSEALEQQTATGEILSSMSGSTADTKPVFDAIVRNLFRLFGTRTGCYTME
jgi:GAF domain-containing protein